MQPDEDYYTHLGSLNSGIYRQTTYRNYKNATNNYCFELNGSLKGGLDISPYQQIFSDMNQMIRAKNKSDIQVYRMTSDYEFTPSAARVSSSEPFRYPSFLSTS